MELLATVDWLIQREHAEPTVSGIRPHFVDGPLEKRLLSASSDRRCNLRSTEFKLISYLKPLIS